MANRPTFLWGPPGVGKSDIVRSVAKATGRKLIDVRAVTTDPVDWRGIPAVVGGHTRWCPPDFLPKENDGPGLLFLDELAQAPQLVQSALLELTLDRRLGTYTLPKNWAVIAASNRQEDRAGANRMITPLLNRFVHIDVGVDPDQWLIWATSHHLAPEVISYIKMRPDALYDFDPARNERAFPTPRSWAFVSDLLEAFREPTGEVYSEGEAPALLAAVGGCIGAGAAAPFAAHLQTIALLPNPRDVLTKPKTTPLPTEPSLVYALVIALASVCRREPTLLGGYAEVLRRLEAEYAWFGLTQVTAGLSTAEKSKIVCQPGWQECVAMCKKAGIMNAGAA